MRFIFATALRAYVHMLEWGAALRQMSSAGRNCVGYDLKWAKNFEQLPAGALVLSLPAQTSNLRCSQELTHHCLCAR